MSRRLEGVQSLYPGARQIQFTASNTTAVAANSTTSVLWMGIGTWAYFNVPAGYEFRCYSYGYNSLMGATVGTYSIDFVIVAEDGTITVIENMTGANDVILRCSAHRSLRRAPLFVLAGGSGTTYAYRFGTRNNVSSPGALGGAQFYHIKGLLVKR